jgi:uncharacterized membrane protein
MDPEFQRILIVVLIAGTVVFGAGATVLYFVFRAFGGKQPGSSSHFGLIAALVGFVFACCVLLFLLSYAGH